MTEKPSRHALWPRAQASHDLPTPVGPPISKCWLSRIQLHVVSFWNRLRSSPRGVRRSASSTTAFCRSLASLSLRPSRLFSARGRLPVDQQTEPVLAG